MDRQMLSDTQWSRIADLLPGKPTDKGGRVVDNRRFVEVVLYMARTGCPWRDLPKELGNWHPVYVRFARWETYGVVHMVLVALPVAGDFFNVLLGTTNQMCFRHATAVPFHDQQARSARSNRGIPRLFISSGVLQKA